MLLLLLVVFGKKREKTKAFINEKKWKVKKEKKRELKQKNLIFQ